MRSDILRKALISRRGKKFNYDEFQKEPQEEPGKQSPEGLAPPPLETTPKDPVSEGQDMASDAERVLGRKPFDKKSPAWSEDPESVDRDPANSDPDNDGVDREIGKGLLEENLVRQFENGRKPRSLHDRAQIHISKLVKRKSED